MTRCLVALLATCAVRAMSDASAPSVRNITVGSEVRSVAWSGDGAYIASTSDDGLVRVWDARSGENVRNCTGRAFGVNSAAYSPDGSLLVSGEDNAVRVWTPSCQSLQKLEGHNDTVLVVGFSPPYGKYLASGDQNGTVRVWDTSSWQPAATLRGHADRISSLTFSPDGKRLATSSWDNTVRVWDTATWQTLKTLEDKASWFVNSVSYSPDGGHLTSGHSAPSEDNALSVWNTETWERQSYQAGALGIVSVSYSSDGKYLAAGSDGHGVVRVWDTSSWQVVQVLEGHSLPVSSVRFAPDGRRVASGSWDLTVRIWDLGRDEIETPTVV